MEKTFIIFGDIEIEKTKLLRKRPTPIKTTNIKNSSIL